MFRRSVVLAALLSAPAAWPNPATAQVRVPEGVSVRLSGRLHVQFNTTSVDAEPSSEFLIRRARIGAEVRVSELVSGKVEPDFGGGGISLKDAWARLTFNPAFRVTVGQFKRPFDLFELTSSTRILVIERAGGIRGVATCAGPGGICTYSRFTEKLEYADRDIGIMVDGSRGAVSWAASATNGTGANTADENGTKSFTGRLEVAVRPDVVIAANAAAHDYLPPLETDSEYGVAFGGDLEIGNFSEGLHLQAGVVTGDNWANTTPTTFLAGQGILTYKAPVTGCACVSAIEPLVRVSYSDPDTDSRGDQGWLVTPGLMVHFTGRNRLAVNVDYWSPNTGASEWSLKSQMFFYF